MYSFLNDFPLSTIIVRFTHSSLYINSSSFLLLNSVLLNTGVVPVLSCYKQSCSGQLYTDLRVDICFHLSLVNAQEWTGWVVWQQYVSLLKKLPNYFPEWLSDFTFPSARYESSSTSSLTLGVISFSILDILIVCGSTSLQF